MSEIEELKKQKKEIEKRIRDLENKNLISGKAKRDSMKFSTHRPTEYFVAVLCEPCDGGQARYRRIVESRNMAELPGMLEEVITDLQALLAKMKEETDG